MTSPLFSACSLGLTGGVSVLAGAFLAKRVVQRFGLGRPVAAGLFMYGATSLLIPLRGDHKAI